MMMRLYQREACPACTKVRRMLSGMGIAHTLVNVPKFGSERSELLALNGVDGPEVPVLVDGDTVLQGSDKIIAHLRENHGGGYGDPSYALTRRIEGQSYDDVVAKAREALASEGFGVLTEIDVKATMRKKLDVDFEDYVILGACMPQLAHQALSAEPGVGTLMPCNVVVNGKPDGSVYVSTVDPMKLFGLVDSAGIEDIAKDVRGRLVRVLKKL